MGVDSSCQMSRKINERLIITSRRASAQPLYYPVVKSLVENPNHSQLTDFRPSQYPPIIFNELGGKTFQVSLVDARVNQDRNSHSFRQNNQ